MTPITRALSQPRPIALEGDLFTVKLELTAEPEIEWKRAFTEAATRYPVAHPSTVTFELDRAAVIFHSEKQNVRPWVDHIERCIEAANITFERVARQRQAEEAARTVEAERIRREIAQATEEWKNL